MEYEVLDEHPRRGQLDYYAEHPNPFYSITWPAEISTLKVWADASGYSTHLALCYFMARAMREVEDFRYGLRDGRIVLYDRLHVGTTLPTPDGQFGFAHLDYCDEVSEFMRRAEEARSKVVLDGILRESARANMILFTALPGVGFSSMTHVPAADPTDSRPRVAFGRFEESAGRLTLPIALQVNHRFIGGRALGELAEAVALNYAEPTRSLR